MMRATARRAIVLALTAVLLLPGVATAESRAVTAVTWNVDHATKTITATVRIRIASACTRGQMARATTQGPAAAKRCKVGPEIAKAIKDDVDRVWNQGLTYVCYKLKVVTDIQVSDELTGARAGSEAAPDDRAYVAIDQSPADVRSMVSVHAYNDAQWNGDTPHDALSPANGGDKPSVWKYPPTWERSLYAHEVGHILGMSDHYEDFRGEDGKTYSRPRQGAATDVMSSVTVDNVAESTLHRLVARAGVDSLSFKCDWKVDLPAPGGTVTGTKCGGIEGDWVVRTDLAQGPTKVQQTWTFTADATGGGPFTYEDHSTTEVPQSKSESWGKSAGDGTVTIYVDGSASMELAETTHRSRGKGTAGGRTITVPEDDVPLVTWTLEWKPTVCPPAN